MTDPAFHGPRLPNQQSAPAGDPRSGPLSEVLLKQTVCALRGELQERTTEATRLRGALADSRSELDARAATQARLEAMHGELRGELRGLADLVARESERHAELSSSHDAVVARVAELQAQLAQAERLRGETDERLVAAHDQLASVQGELAIATVSRDAAVSEAAGLRVELERFGTELAIVRERLGSHAGELGDAQTLLSDARALAAQLRERQAPPDRATGGGDQDP
jgi:chromosome segregation ATPase